MPRSKRWKILNEEIAFNNPWYLLKRHEVLLPNGVIVKDYFTSQLPDVVLIFALTPDKKVLMVKQYRHAVQEILLELPAGTYVRGRETPIAAAKRELLEETGYQAKKLKLLGKIRDYPTKDSHVINIYLATNIIYKGSNFTEVTEDIEVVQVPMKDLAKMIAEGKVKVSGSISGIFLALNYLNSHGTA